MSKTRKQRDWRSEPRKADGDKLIHVAFVRVNRRQKDALWILSRLRGETDCQYIRNLIDWQARVVISRESDATMAPVSPVIESLRQQQLVHISELINGVILKRAEEHGLAHAVIPQLSPLQRVADSWSGVVPAGLPERRGNGSTTEVEQP